MKKLILMLALFSAVLGANAQIATENSNALDNISVGVTAGVSTPLDFNSVFPLNTNVGLKLQKDFTPEVGVQLEGLAILNDNHFSDIKTMVKATNVGVNGAFNLSNMFGEYMGIPRAFEVSAIVGLGWLHNWDTSVNNLTSKTGFDFAFNLGKKKAHSLVLTPAVYWNLTGNYPHHKVQFNKNFAQLAVNLSYVYHFNTSNGTHHFKTYDVGAMIDEINRLNGALEECEKRKPKVIEKIVEVKVPATDAVAVKSGNDSWVVMFATASSKLTKEAEFVLNQIGNDAIVDVTATASPDGTAEFNQKLSEMRAARVKDYLVNRGVKVNSCEGKGVNPETGKTAIVKTVQ
jgi:hypothetical protein